jgi:PAS domain S-box-containing protein
LEEENAMLRIKKISLIYLPILLALIYLFSEGAHAQQAPPKKNVLVLHGQWRMRTYEIPFNSTLHNEFLASEAVTVGTTHVYLGLEDFPDSAYPQKLIEQLRYRIEKNPVDLVISFLPDANKFLLSYGQELFPGVPMVLAIPSTRDVQKIKKLKNAVIVPSIFEKAMQNTVDNIFSLLPDTRQLVVVCGDAPFDRNYLEIAKRAIASSKQDAKVSYLIGLPLDELWRRISNLATGTAILFTTYDEEKNGKKHEASDVSALLAINANAPVFSVNGSLLGNGIVGGTITSPESYAKKTAEVALRLFQGSQLTEISTIDYAPFDVYDWRALKRWKISEDRLPSGSQVRYKTETFWETHKVTIIVVIGVMCLETMLIYALFISLMRSKRIKEALQESEERHRTLQENVPVGVYRTSNSGKFISVNPAVFKMLKLDAGEDLSSYQVTDFYNDPEKRRDVLSQLKTEGKITDFEVEFRRKDGSSFWGSLSATQVTDKDGNFIFMDGVVQDITERKQAEEELKIKDSAIASSISGIGIADLEGRLTYVNDSLVEMWGYESADEILGRKLPEFWEGEGVLETIEALREKGGKIGEDIGKRKDGSVFDVQFSASMIKDEAGKSLYMFGSFIDITERKIAEIELRGAYTEIEQLKNQLEAESAYLQDEIKLEHNFENIIGQSEALKYVLHRVEQVAPLGTRPPQTQPSRQTGTGEGKLRGPARGID